MRFPERRAQVMRRSVALGHCVCDPKKDCPCDIFIDRDLCLCAGERPDAGLAKIRLTEHVRKAGCASKIGPADLRRVLESVPEYDHPDVLVGVAAGDDAGVYRLDGPHNLVQTVDVFTPVVDDPFMFGRISAANSVSDIYAMGGRPICALSIIGFPIETVPHEVMGEILRGGVEAMREAGVSVIGGHSINDEEIKCGFAVTRLVAGTGCVTNAGAQPGDQLVLTKPLGVGCIAFAAQIGRASEEAMDLISRSMAELNKDASELMLVHGAHACTDVTGFGLLGHLAGMCRGGGVSARIELAQTPLFAEAAGCIRRGMAPGSVDRNREAFGQDVLVNGGTCIDLMDLLYDAQTSGGLLVALPPEQVEGYVAAMQARGHAATARIGEILRRGITAIEVMLAEPANLIGAGHGTGQPGRESTACCGPVGEADTGRLLRQETVVLGNHNNKGKQDAGETMMTESAKQTGDAFKGFMKQASAAGALDGRAKRLLSIGLSIAQRCKPCAKIHIEQAIREGVTWDEIDETAWLAVAFAGCPARMMYDEVKQEIVKI